MNEKVEEVLNNPNVKTAGAGALGAMIAVAILEIGKVAWKGTEQRRTNIKNHFNKVREKAKAKRAAKKESIILD